MQPPKPPMPIKAQRVYEDEGDLFFILSPLIVMVVAIIFVFTK